MVGQQEIEEFKNWNIQNMYEYIQLQPTRLCLPKGTRITFDDGGSVKFPPFPMPPCLPYRNHTFSVRLMTFAQTSYGHRIQWPPNDQWLKGYRTGRSSRGAPPCFVRLPTVPFSSFLHDEHYMLDYQQTEKTKGIETQSRYERLGPERRRGVPASEA
jgi:hypothetical protein